jgi:hypothetical protein
MNVVWSLGYWLVEAVVPISAESAVHYRGIDRQPIIPGPDEDEGLRREGRDTLLQIRDRYWQLEESGVVHADSGVAVELRDEFAAEGIGLEVVLAAIVEIPELEDIPSDLRALFERNLGNRQITPRTGSGLDIVPLGIDVTYPFPAFHSAIRQPVLRVAAPSLMDGLNSAGLFPAGQLDVAREAVELCNQRDTSWRPFCVVAISAIA